MTKAKPGAKTKSARAPRVPSYGMNKPQAGFSGGPLRPLAKTKGKDPTLVLTHDTAAPRGAKAFDPSKALSVVPEEFRQYWAAAVWLPRELVSRWLKNPRKNAKAVPRVRLSMERFGFIAPLCVWTSKNRLVAGDTRTISFDELVAEHGDGWMPRGAPGPGLVPVRFHEFADEAEADAYGIADNKLGELAEWDQAKLEDIVEEFAGDRELFDATGLDHDEFFADPGDSAPTRDPDSGGESDDPKDKLPDDDGKPDARDVLPPPPKEPRCKVGDLWILGEHRLLCGDTFSADARMRLLEGRCADAIATDPPYAVFGSSTGIGKDIVDDKMIRPFFEALFRACAVSVKNFGHIYCCCDWRSWAAVWHGASVARITPKNCIVWDKGGGIGSMYAQCHEFVGFFVLEPDTRSLHSGKAAGHRMVNRKNVIAANRPAGDERVHGAQKPVVLLSEFIVNATEKGETVVDFFGGSGTTLIACEDLGRKACLMEQEPRECDKILARWEKLTGKTAELAAA